MNQRENQMVHEMINDFGRRLATKEQELIQAKRARSDAIRIAHRFEQQNERLEDHVSSMRVQIRQLKGQAQANDTLRTEISELRSLLQDRDAEVAEKAHELAELRAEIKYDRAVARNEEALDRRERDDLRNDLEDARDSLRDERGRREHAEREALRFMGIAEGLFKLLAQFEGPSSKDVPKDAIKLAGERQAAIARLGKQDVSPEARQRILDQAREYGILPEQTRRPPGRPEE